jgi:alpha-tubulin suppressor-like RCC1 family protein
VLRLFLCLILPTFLAACGSGDSDEPTTINIFSNAVYAGHSLGFNPKSTTLYAWGANGYGQLGNGSRMDRYSPVALGGSYTAFAIGGAHSVAIGTDGFVYAWGHNSSGQLGDNTIVTSSKAVQVVLSDGITTTPLTGIKQISAGSRHTLAIAADDTVLAWGSNTRGQLGDGTVVNAMIPVPVINTQVHDIVAIAGGGEFSLALRSIDGTVWAWGSNTFGQLGNNSTTNSDKPVQVLKAGGVPLDNIVAIAAGGSHALAIDTTGKIWAWGYNAFGQLGTLNHTNSPVAIGLELIDINKVAIPGTATAISAGLDHTLAVIGDYVYSWGYNKHGQLGNGKALGDELPVYYPQKVVLEGGGPLLKIKSVTAVGHHSLARDADGIVYSWGENSYGELGDGNVVSRSYAATVNLP